MQRSKPLELGVQSLVLGLLAFEVEGFEIGVEKVLRLGNLKPVLEAFLLSNSGASCLFDCKPTVSDESAQGVMRIPKVKYSGGHVVP